MASLDSNEKTTLETAVENFRKLSAPAQSCVLAYLEGMAAATELAKSA